MITDLVQGLGSMSDFSVDPLDGLLDLVGGDLDSNTTDNLILNLQAKTTPPVATALSNLSSFAQGTNRNVNQLLKDYALMYGTVTGYGALLQAVYAVRIDNVFGHSGDIPWFKDMNLGFLATEADLSLGSNESESGHAGAYQFNWLTQKSSDETEVTFIETADGDIAKSYSACRKLAFNKDGTVNEPKKYAFKLTVYLLNPKDTRKVAVKKSWLVGVKSGSTEVSASGRSEVVKINVTFQKLRPMLFG